MEAEHVMFILDTGCELVKRIVWKVATVFIRAFDRRRRCCHGLDRLRYKRMWSPLAKQLHEAVPESYKFDIHIIKTCRVVFDYSKVISEGVLDLGGALPRLTKVPKPHQVTERDHCIINRRPRGINKLELFVISEGVVLNAYIYWGNSDEAMLEAREALQVMMSDRNLISSSLDRKDRHSNKRRAHIKGREVNEILLLLKQDSRNSFGSRIVSLLSSSKARL